MSSARSARLGPAFVRFVDPLKATSPSMISSFWCGASHIPWLDGMTFAVRFGASLGYSVNSARAFASTADTKP